MYRQLIKSIREFKRPSILSPVFVSLEVVMECVIPFVIAQLVNQIKAGCGMGVIAGFGAALIAMAGLSLLFGVLAGNACAKVLRLCAQPVQGYVLPDTILFL